MVELSSKAMFVFYCMGAATAGFTVIGAIFGLFASGRMSAAMNFMISLVMAVPKPWCYADKFNADMMIT